MRLSNRVRRRRHGLGAAVVLILGWSLLVADDLRAQEQAGRIAGRLQHEDGTAIGGVSLLLNDTGITAITDRRGEFSFPNVPPGKYSLTLVLGENTTTIADVTVAAGATTRVDETLDWEQGFSEQLIVAAPSRRLERIVDAPGAVTTVPPLEIARRASHAQLPKLLEFTPGVELAQSGVYDFNLNTRGFNSSLNRRVATLVDGRDPSIPFLMSQDWSALPFPLDEVDSLEFVRGPSAALYGPNASSGVLNMTTKAPRDSQGGQVRLTLGQLETVNLDLRWARPIDDRWFFKLIGGVRRNDQFTVSRRGAAEYSRPCGPGVTRDCLPQEVVPFRRSDDRVFLGAGRLDGYLGQGMMLTVEGGIANTAGPVLQTGIGRVQVLDVRRPWARVNLNGARFNVLAAYTGRHAPEQLSLASGTNLALDDHRIQWEGQTNRSFADDRLRLVVGATAVTESVDSYDAALGRQTLLFEPVRANRQAVFGQADWNAARRLKLVAAGRVDFSSLHDPQFSPKASAVYSITPDQTLRLTYNQAFQVPNYSELFLQVDAAPPANLSALEAVCRPFNVSCGFGPTRVLALGNSDLLLEKIETWEFGYKAVLAGRAFVTVDVFRSAASNFVTDLLPQLGTALGRVNPSFGPWQPPSGLPEPAAATIRALAPPILSNNVDGSTILAAASYTNFGRVRARGVDLGVNYYPSSRWRASFSYSWFGFDIDDQLSGFESLLLPNTPEHAFSAGGGYERAPFNVALGLRWVDDFRWGVGPFQGDVKRYTTVDLTANYDVGRRVTLGLNVANLFDDKHWETFGGDILRRRALGSLQFKW